MHFAHAEDQYYTNMAEKSEDGVNMVTWGVIPESSDRHR